MLDFEPGKLMLVGVVALLVIGPKDLPRVLRQAGQAMGKVRRMAQEFQGQFMEAMREADQADIAKSLNKEMSEVADAAKASVAFDPLQDIRAEVSKTKSAIDGALAAQAAVEPGGEFSWGNHSGAEDALESAAVSIASEPQAAAHDAPGVAEHVNQPSVLADIEPYTPAPAPLSWIETHQSTGSDATIQPALAARAPRQARRMHQLRAARRMRKLRAGFDAGFAAAAEGAPAHKGARS
jgi:sec-independent protein translocase protein TatB